MNYYLLNTLAKQENAVCERLAAKGFRTYNPQARTTRKQFGKLATVVEALFPGYVFIEMNLVGSTLGDVNAKTNVDWLNVRGTEGVKDFLKFANRPAIVDRSIVDALKAKEHKGCISITKAQHNPKVGEKVRVIGGPMKNLEGILSEKLGAMRSMVLLRILTEETPVQLDNVWIERA